jgi:hypothetical protein
MSLYVTGMTNNKATKEQSFRVEIPVDGSRFRFLQIPGLVSFVSLLFNL